MGSTFKDMVFARPIAVPTGSIPRDPITLDGDIRISEIGSRKIDRDS
jgi:hypothetical protein